MSTKLTEVAVLLNKVNALENLVIVDNLKIEGNLPTGEVVTVECRDFKFNTSSYGTPVQFSVVVRIDGKYASRWDMSFEKDQKEWQDGWVRLVAQLQREQWKKEDEVREVASVKWNTFNK